MCAVVGSAQEHEPESEKLHPWPTVTFSFQQKLSNFAHAVIYTGQSATAPNSY